MGNSSEVKLDPRVAAQMEAFDWLIGQTSGDMMGALVRAWLVQKRNLIARAGGTPPTQLN